METLRDNRLLRRLDDVEKIMHEKVAWVIGLPDLVFQRLAAHIGPDFAHTDLRNLVVLATLSGLSYVKAFGFDVYRNGPTGLTQGDIRANVQRLVSLAEQPEHVTCRKIHEGVNLGFLLFSAPLQLQRPLSCIPGLCAFYLRGLFRVKDLRRLASPPNCGHEALL